MRIPYKIGAVSIYTNSALAYNSYCLNTFKRIGGRGNIGIDLINYVKRKKMRIRATLHFAIGLYAEEVFGHQKKLIDTYKYLWRSDRDERIVDPMVNYVKRK